MVINFQYRGDYMRSLGIIALQYLACILGYYRKSYLEKNQLKIKIYPRPTIRINWIDKCLLHKLHVSQIVAQLRPVTRLPPQTITRFIIF